MKQQENNNSVSLSLKSLLRVWDLDQKDSYKEETIGTQAGFTGTW